MRNTWLGNTALLLALSAAPYAALAVSDADKAFSAQLEEINKKAVGLQFKGDGEGLSALVLHIDKLLTTPGVSSVCMEAAQARRNAVASFVQFLQADDDADTPFMKQTVGQYDVYYSKRSACSGEPAKKP